EYDPLLAKLAVWASSRQSAIERMNRALTELAIHGIRTNRTFFQEILADDEFRAGALSTGFLEEFFKRRPAKPQPDPEMEAVAAVIAALQLPKSSNGAGTVNRKSAWVTSGREDLFR